MPLFEWRERLADTADHRRWPIAAVTAAAASCMGLLATNAITPCLVLNVSASAPRGLYLVDPHAVPSVGDMVVARMPEPFRALADRRGYIPAAIPVVKRVAAAKGDRVCAWAAAIIVNGRLAVTRRRTDGQGRPLPWWRGCVTLGSGALFLLMADRPDSLDGRYFGLTARRDLLGKAALIWAR
jgi:conjugative transfer signal peptidase TraF